MTNKKDEKEKEVEVEAVEGEDIDVEGQSASPAVIEQLTNQKALEAYEYVAANIDRFVAAQKKIRDGILRIALAGDWVVFGTEKEEGQKTEKDSDTANLSYGGCTRIVNTLRVSITNRSELERIAHKDEKGDWYEYRQYADFNWNGLMIKGVMGVVSTRDRFFGKSYGKFKDVWDVQEHWVARACHRAVVKEGVKLIFGLHQVPIRDLAAAGVKLEDAKSYKFKDSAAPKGDGSLISDPQRKRLFAILKESETAGLCSEAELRKHLETTYKITTTNAIKKENYEEVVDWVRGIGR